ncbi:MAG: hypothetical protein U0326_31675 [Polyangiales bacterium]
MGENLRVEGSVRVVTRAPQEAAAVAYRATATPVTLRLTPVPAANDDPDSVTFAAECASLGAGQVTFRAEDAQDRFGKRTGLNVEPQTGDADFDREVYVMLDNITAQTGRAMLASPAARSALRALVSKGLTVKAGRGSITVGPIAAETLDRYTPRDLETLASSLASLATAWRDLRWTRRSELLSVVIGVAAIVAAFASVPLHIVAPAEIGSVTGDRSIVVGLALACLWALALGISQRKNGTGLGCLTAMMLVCVPGLAPLFVMGLAAANRQFDRSAPQSIVATTRVVEHTSDDGTYTSQEFTAPVGAYCAGAKVSVPSSQVEGVGRVDPPRIEVTLHRGRAGWCWVSRARHAGE